MIMGLDLKLFCFSLYIVVTSIVACEFSSPSLKEWALRRRQHLGDDVCVGLAADSDDDPTGVNDQSNVKVFLFQKDEHEVLGDWLQYYSYLFGIRNLVIIDHDSQRVDVCHLLALYQSCGAQVTSYSGLFLHKHAVLSKEMRKHKDTFLLPLDADEFILPSARAVNGSLSVERDALHKALNMLPVDGRKYKFEYSYFARPNDTSCVASALHLDSEEPDYRRVVHSQKATDKRLYFSRSKTFYHSAGFLATDQGNHFGNVEHDEKVYNDHPTIERNISHYFAVLDAAIVHYSISSYHSLKVKYLRAFHAYNFTSDTDCTSITNGISYCLRGKLFLNESSEEGQKYYFQTCLSEFPGSSLQKVSGWFKNEARTLLQLVGF